MGFPLVFIADTHGSPMILHWWSMGHQWVAHGPPWVCHGSPMSNSWVYGTVPWISDGLIALAHRSPMVPPWVPWDSQTASGKKQIKCITRKQRPACLLIKRLMSIRSPCIKVAQTWPGRCNFQFSCSGAVKSATHIGHIPPAVGDAGPPPQATYSVTVVS